MAGRASVNFVAWSAMNDIAREEGGATLAVFAGKDLAFGPATSALLGAQIERIRKAAVVKRFKGATGTAMEFLPADGFEFGRIVVVGVGVKEDAGAPPPQNFANLGGFCLGKTGAGRICVAFDLPEPAESLDSAAADFALGAELRCYKFDLYKTKKQDDDEKDTPSKISIAVERPLAAEPVGVARALADGVIIARDLVNEPANILFPVEFAARVKELEKVGVEVEILDEAELRSIGMRCLLAVGQGSRRESRVAIMKWNGASDSNAPPVAFIGKGVCFDTGGVSIKPASGMEDMKGDMAGAACVTGLLHALAARKARVNVIGAIGLVENAVDGNAQRPGDIVVSLSGQTVEVINTDAEGRLVLADVIWHINNRFAPRFIVDLATLTGAILVALGSEHAGLFSNDDALSEQLIAAGKLVDEKVWRMPLGSAYDKLLDSKFADMKNVGGRHAGSITAAQFIQRFVKDVPWAHLDIAGTSMASPQTETNQGWASGWGVRLLNRLVADHYEE